MISTQLRRDTYAAYQARRNAQGELPSAGNKKVKDRVALLREIFQKIFKENVKQAGMIWTTLGKVTATALGRTNWGQCTFSSLFGRPQGKANHLFGSDVLANL